MAEMYPLWIHISTDIKVGTFYDLTVFHTCRIMLHIFIFIFTLLEAHSITLSPHCKGEEIFIFFKSSIHAL